MTRTEQVLEGMIRHYHEVMQDNLPTGMLSENDVNYIRESAKDLEAMARILKVYRNCGFKDIDIEETAEDAEDKDKIIQDLKNKLRRYENEAMRKYSDYVKANSIDVKSKKYEQVYYDITYMAWYDRTIIYVVDDRQADNEPAKIELLTYFWGDVLEEDLVQAENLDRMFDNYYDNDINDTRANVALARAEHILEDAHELCREAIENDQAKDMRELLNNIMSQAQGIIEALGKENK